jgi:hypothetical protein
VPVLTALVMLLVGAAANVAIYYWLRDNDEATPAADTTAALPIARLANVPAAAPALGAYAESVVRRNGTVEVRQWIRSEQPIQRLVLALPRVPGHVNVAAADVLVIADGQPVDGPSSITGDPATYELGAARDVRVAYVVTGAVELSNSAAGRALAAATSVDVTPRPPTDVRVVRAPQVLNLACSPSVAVVPVPCGRRLSADAWGVELTGDEGAGRVVAQVAFGDG